MGVLDDETAKVLRDYLERLAAVGAQIAEIDNTLTVLANDVAAALALDNPPES